MVGQLIFNVIAILSLILIVDASQANTQVLLAGGGCDSAFVESHNDFYPEFQEALKEYKRLGVTPTTMFGNNGASALEAIPFHEDDFWDYLEKIKTQSWPEGSQLLIHINTHGSIDPQTKEHTLCFSELNEDNEMIKKYVPVSKIKEKLQEIQLSFPQLNLAFIDNSCFGGKTVEVMKDEKICVISSTTPLSPSEFRGYFNYQFLRQLKKGQSLSSCYVETIQRNGTFKLRKNRDIPMLNSLNPEILENFISISDLLATLEDDLGYEPNLSIPFLSLDDYETVYEEIESPEDIEKKKTPLEYLTDRLNAILTISSDNFKLKISQLESHGPPSMAFKKTIKRMKTRIKKIEKSWPRYFTSVLANWDAIPKSDGVDWINCGSHDQRNFTNHDMKKTIDDWSYEIDEELVGYFEDLYDLRQQLDEYFRFNLDKVGEDNIFAGPAKSACDNWKF